MPDTPSLRDIGGKRTHDEAFLEDDEVATADAEHPRGVALVHVANIKRASKEEKIKTTINRFKHFCANHPQEYKGFHINANTVLENVPYEVWDDNSDDSLVGHFMTYLITACYLNQPSKRLAYRTPIQLASTLKEHVINLHKAK